MGNASKAIKLKLEGQRRRALAPEYDPVRRDFDLGVASGLEQEAQALLTPPKPLQTGLGGEIIPPMESGLPGLESVLQEPDLLNLAASEQRAHLLERNGVLELGIEAAQNANAQGAIEKMMAHEMVAAHNRAMELMAESASETDPDIAIKKARTSARLMDSFSRAALTLDRLQRGGGQTIQVQYMQVNTMVGGEPEKMQNPACSPKSKGGRPPTTGYRTKQAIAQRKADRELLSEMQRLEDIG